MNIKTIAFLCIGLYSFVAFILAVAGGSWMINISRYTEESTLPKPGSYAWKETVLNNMKTDA